MYNSEYDDYVMGGEGEGEGDSELPVPLLLGS